MSRSVCASASILPCVRLRRLRRLPFKVHVPAGGNQSEFLTSKNCCRSAGGLSEGRGLLHAEAPRAARNNCSADQGDVQSDLRVIDDQLITYKKDARERRSARNFVPRRGIRSPSILESGRYDIVRTPS